VAASGGPLEILGSRKGRSYPPHMPPPDSTSNTNRPSGHLIHHRYASSRHEPCHAAGTHRPVRGRGRPEWTSPDALSRRDQAPIRPRARCGRPGLTRRDDLATLPAGARDKRLTLVTLAVVMAAYEAALNRHHGHLEPDTG
jgi:hypothetical protein